MTSFHCHNCGSVTDVSHMLQAFEQNPYCPTCGLSLSEIDTKMQDDLADLMARNMNIGMQAPAHDVSSPPTPQVVPQPAPITYISQHYHHSAHLVPPASNEEEAASTILRSVGVNTDVLLPSQLQLFKNAQPEQRNRLVELWRIAPPTYGDQLMGQNMGNWPQTSLEVEEQAARQRWEKQEQERLRNLSALPSQAHAEPYMQNGYDTGMSMDEDKPTYRQATDPAYSVDRGREWWHMSAEEPMEHQYGMMQHMQMMHGICDTVDREHLW